MISKPPILIICHGKKTIDIALKNGWQPGARYTNLRCIKSYSQVALIDIDWKNYDFDKHLKAVKEYRPHLTVARDILSIDDLGDILIEASILKQYCDKVIIVPKDLRLGPSLSQIIPQDYVLGYSVPTTYGGTKIPPCWFSDRKVHLLGGGPKKQLELANKMNIYSLDTNSIAVGARFGWFFNGQKTEYDSSLGFYECVESSLMKIKERWHET